MPLINKIFISSIVQKSSPFRNDLVEALQEIDFEPIVYTHPDLELNEDENYSGHDECLLMIKKCDALIGIVDHEPGKHYRGEILKEVLSNLEYAKDGVSISAAEIIYAKHVLKIPTIVLLMPYVFNAYENNSQNIRLQRTTKNLLSYLVSQPKGNYFFPEIGSTRQALNSISKCRWQAIKRLKIIGNALEGPNWNGEYYFNDQEVTIRNGKRPDTSALNTLLRKNGLPASVNEKRLWWLLELLNPINDEHKLEKEELKFVYDFILYYAGYSIEKTLVQEVKDEKKAINLIKRLDFGNDDIFQGYEHRIHGGPKQKMRWPDDAKEWSPHGRVEFILYSLGMENSLPTKLQAIIDFVAESHDHTGVSKNRFSTNISRKPVTVGCLNAAKVRLRRHNSSRGILVEEEMKSMIYITYTGSRYCLVAVHGKGDMDVDIQSVLRAFSENYNLDENNIPRINRLNLLEYLDKLDCPEPDEIYEDKKITKHGAQELISLYSSAINPISVLMFTKYKYEYLLDRNIKKGFDVLMLWDDSILNVGERYNNAGSPTWGQRFDPDTMYSLIKLNIDDIISTYTEKGLSVKFKIKSGTFFKYE